MFDSTTPHIPQPVEDRKSANELVPNRPVRLNGARRRVAENKSAKRRPTEEPVLDLIAHWDGDLAAFDQCVDLAISWGPFELAEVYRAFVGHDGKRRLLCRFVYHGAQRDRRQFEHALKTCLAQITKWDELDEMANSSFVSVAARP